MLTRERGSSRRRHSGFERKKAGLRSNPERHGYEPKALAGERGNAVHRRDQPTTRKIHGCGRCSADRPSMFSLMYFVSETMPGSSLVP